MRASKRTQASIRAELKGLKNRRKERRGEENEEKFLSEMMLFYLLFGCPSE